MTPKRVGSTIAHRGIQRPKAPQFKKDQDRKQKRIRTTPSTKPTTTTGLGSFNPFKWFTWFDPPPEQRKAPSVALEKKQKKQNDKQPRPTINNSNQKVKTDPPSPPPFDFNVWTIVQNYLFGQPKALTGDVSPGCASDKRHSSDNSSTKTDNSDHTSNTSKKTTARSKQGASEASSQKTDRPPFEAPLKRKWRELLEAKIREEDENTKDSKRRRRDLGMQASVYGRRAGYPRPKEDEEALEKAHRKLRGTLNKNQKKLERPYNGELPTKRQRHQ